LIRTFLRHSGSVKCLAVSPAVDALIASGGRDGNVCLWDLRANGVPASFGKERVGGQKECRPRPSILLGPVVQCFGIAPDASESAWPPPNVLLLNDKYSIRWIVCR
jgi:WD40 repeat protein